MNANNVFDLIDPSHASAFNRRTLTAAALVSGVSQERIYAFPESLRSSEGQVSSAHVPFVLFAPYKRNTRTFYSLDSTNVFDSLPSPSWLIALPLPASALRTGYGVQYDQYDIGFGFGTTMLSAKKLLQPISLEEGKAVRNRVEEVLEESSIESSKNPILGNIFESMGYNAVAGIASGIKIPEPVMQTFAGISENPYTEQIFKNVEFRTHTFEYMFIPRNERESRLIDEIIQVFKFYMLPAQGALSSIGGDSTNFFSFPYEFQITYSVQDTTFTLLPSVLERFDVDYSGADQPKFFVSSGEGKQYPTKITMTLQFREVVLLNRDHIAAPAPVIKEAVDSRNVTRYRF